MLRTGICIAAGCGFSTAAEAQVSPAADVGASPDARPGRYRLGPIYVTPRLRLGNIGLDTNVFHTAVDRRTDVSGSGGPALDIAIPIKGRSQLFLSSGLEYIYFVRTASERRLGGDVAGGLKLEGARTRLYLDAGYGRMYRRPSLDIDRRLEQTGREAHGLLRRRVFGATAISIETRVRRQEVDNAEHLGVDLGRTLTQDTRTIMAAIENELTVKTRLVLRGELESSRFPRDPSRDGQRSLLVAGLQTDSRALVSGQLLLGLRTHRLVSESFPGRRTMYASIHGMWHGWPRMRLGGGYGRDRNYSPFAALTGPPTQHVESYSVVIGREVVRNVNLNLTGSRSRLRTDGTIRLEVGPGEPTEAVRDDDIYEAGAELAYSVRSNLSVGVSARYSERRSSFRDLDIEGLLLGSTIIFTP